jgi:hypothetical protein
VQVREKIVEEGKLNLSAEPEILHQFERLVFTFTKIRLMIRQIADISQAILRREWHRVKRGA